ncbi:hypothetical protein HPB50_019892 [Hyalomma asiaticum]|uniref:Uncharacterized protein n=1 Tax=Hyalomma asiaticum TaxID=266040 RepID=A0ACB7SPN4_HYAAI|nr:hypothetical protein HPB50_019892 [Hyalomma asiaticum]
MTTADKTCRGCGCKNPQQDHNCKAECQLCGKDHLTRDKKCKARYKVPYLVRRRRWERRRREEEYYYHTNKEARGSNSNPHEPVENKQPSTDKEETTRKNCEQDAGRDRLWTLQVQAQIPDQIKVEAAVRFANCSRGRQEQNTGELGKRGLRHSYSAT